MKKTIEITKETAVKLLEILQDSEKEEIYKSFPDIRPKKRWFKEYEGKGDFYIHKTEKDEYFSCDTIYTDGYFKHYFIKEEQAQQHAKKLNLYTEMQVFANFRNGDWVADWNDKVQGKYSITLEGFKIRIFSTYTCMHCIFPIAVKNKEIAEEMLEEFGDRIKECFNLK